VTVVDAAAGARPGLDHPAARGFVDAVLGATGRAPVAKLGWTDVARFAALGIPAVNFGPGDPLLAHTADERCPLVQVEQVRAALRAWLSA
jgi:succinyl-diaminopimelate desuccinylase